MNKTVTITGKITLTPDSFNRWRSQISLPQDEITWEHYVETILWTKLGIVEDVCYEDIVNSEFDYKGLTITIEENNEYYT